MSIEFSYVLTSTAKNFLFYILLAPRETVKKSNKSADLDGVCFASALFAVLLNLKH